MRISTSPKSPWAKKALVTTPNFSLIGPKTGSLANTTIAFWTVLLVTSAPFFSKASEAIWRLQEIPKIVEGDNLGHSRWK